MCHLKATIIKLRSFEIVVYSTCSGLKSSPKSAFIETYMLIQNINNTKPESDNKMLKTDYSWHVSANVKQYH